MKTNNPMNTTKRNKPTPTISMRDFMELPIVRAAQEILKRNPYGSAAHLTAFADVVAEAAKYNAQEFIGEY